jgi:hypothetical protein
MISTITIFTKPGDGYYTKLESALDRYKVGDNSGITTVIIDDEIDRGVEDFIYFANLLHKYYPDLTALTFRQNFSFDEDKEDMASLWEDDLIGFIKILNLSYLEMRDCQSDWFQSVNWQNVLDAMPDGSNYVISSMPGDCEPCLWPYCTCNVPCTENKKICGDEYVLKRQGRTLTIHIHK